MARYKHPSRKKRLAKFRKQTRWAPFWTVQKIYGKVKRYTHIQVTALDAQGNPISFEAKKFFARVIQHEVDHLDGILFIDKAKDTYTIEKIYYNLENCKIKARRLY